MGRELRSKLNPQSRHNVGQDGIPRGDCQPPAPRPAKAQLTIGPRLSNSNMAGGDALVFVARPWKRRESGSAGN
jgi:hypothetical protein